MFLSLAANIEPTIQQQSDITAQSYLYFVLKYIEKSKVVGLHPLITHIIFHRSSTIVLKVTSESLVLMCYMKACIAYAISVNLVLKFCCVMPPPPIEHTTSAMI